MYLQTRNTYQDKINTICPKSPLQAGKWYKSRLASGIQNDRFSSGKSHMNDVGYNNALNLSLTRDRLASYLKSLSSA